MSMTWTPPQKNTTPTVGNGLSIDGTGRIVLGGTLDTPTQIDATGEHLLLLADNGTSLYFSGGEIFIGANDVAGDQATIQLHAGTTAQMNNIIGGNTQGINMTSATFELDNSITTDGIRIGNQPSTPVATTLASFANVTALIGVTELGSTHGSTSFPSNLVNFNTPNLPVGVPTVYEIGCNLNISAYVAGDIYFTVTYTDLNGNVQTIQIGPVYNAVGSSIADVLTIEPQANTNVTIAVTPTVFTNTFSASAYCRQIFQDA